MESFSINLNQMAETSGRYKRFLIILGLFFIVISAISFIFIKNNSIEWIFGVLGFYVVVFFYFAYTGNKVKLYFSSDEYAIEYQFGFFVKTPNAIIWETIKRVKIGPTYITFFKRSGKGKVVQLGWLPYTKVIEIKGKIKSFCESKGIQVDVADFIKEQPLSEEA